MFIQKVMWVWFCCMAQTFLAQHRFSAFWLRSKCSICSYQLNIWYGGHVPPSILNWFLQGDEVQELAPASSRVGLALQYRQDRPTSPLTPWYQKIISSSLWLMVSISFQPKATHLTTTSKTAPTPILNQRVQENIDDPVFVPKLVENDRMKIAYLYFIPLSIQIET